ncbi:MAG: rhodanese-like domain-containing protein [Gammaproteobacteria bacterium]
MTVNARISVKQMVEEANAEIETLSAAEAVALLAQDDVVVVDVRDVRELEREGRIPGAFHAPRGMVEFWVDPASPYFKDIFNEDKRFVFYCAASWRSALAAHAAQRIGLERASHIDGGFKAWKEAGGPVEEYRRKA